MDRTYNIHQMPGGSSQVWEYRDGQAFRQVSDQHQTYLAWVEGGGVPETVVIQAPAGPTLEEVKDRLKARIEAKRDRVIASGVRIEFPDGPAVIQTRDETDIRNANGIAAQGLARVVAGQAAEPGQLVFRDEGNLNHSMTPAQAVAFGEQLVQAIQTVYAASWAKKAEVDALAGVGAAQAYDTDADWPALR